MLKKIGIHFEENLLKKLNEEINIKLSPLVNYLLFNFIKSLEKKSWEDKNELQKNIQKFIFESKEQKL